MNLSNAVAADVVVVGAGASGLAAALSASENGHSVIILEKSSQIGGNLARSVGVFSASPAQSRPQNNKGNKTKNTTHNKTKQTDRHFEYLAQRNHSSEFRKWFSHHESQSPVDNPSLRKLYVENVDDLKEWLTRLGVVLETGCDQGLPGSPVHYAALPNSTAYITQLIKAVNRRNIRVFMDARVIGLSTWDGPVRRVNGVEVDLVYEHRNLDPDRDVVLVKATKGVVLATGDFSANSTLKKQLMQSHGAVVDGLNSLNTGDGHIMARGVGGVVVNPSLAWGPGFVFSHALQDSHNRAVSFDKPLSTFSRLIWKVGRRFSENANRVKWIKSLAHGIAFCDHGLKLGASIIDESGQLVAGFDLHSNNDSLYSSGSSDPSRSSGSWASSSLSNDHKDAYYWMVFDESVADKMRQTACSVAQIPNVLDLTLDECITYCPDVIVRAEGLDDLAKKTGMLSWELAVSLSLSAGAELNQRHEKRNTSTPMFAVGPLHHRMMATQGGMAVSEKMQILDGDDEPIPGLYGAGALGQGGVLLPGHGYQLGWAFISGRQAGACIADANTDLGPNRNLGPDPDADPVYAPVSNAVVSQSDHKQEE